MGADIPFLQTKPIKRLVDHLRKDPNVEGGVLIVPYSLPGDQFARIARQTEIFADQHPSKLAPYQVDFLPSQIKPNFS
jgi:hypothetical protein